MSPKKKISMGGKISTYIVEVTRKIYVVEGSNSVIIEEIPQERKK